MQKYLSQTPKTSSKLDGSTCGGGGATTINGPKYSSRWILSSQLESGLITGTKACASPVISVWEEAQNVWRKMEKKIKNKK